MDPVKHIPLAVPALLPVLLLTACGGDESAADESAKKSPTTSPTSAAPTSTSPSPSPTPPPDPETAADGRNLRACRDGKCEVVVKPGDVIRFNDKVGAGPLTITVYGGQLAIMTSSGFTSTVNGEATLESGPLLVEIADPKGKRRTAIRISLRD